MPAPVAAVGAAQTGVQLSDALLNRNASPRVESINGMAGIVVSRGGRVSGVLSIRVHRPVIVEAWLVLNPEQLTRGTC